MNEHFEGRAARARAELVSAFEQADCTAPPVTTIHRRAARRRATRGALALVLVLAGAGVLKEQTGSDSNAKVATGQPTKPPVEPGATTLAPGMETGNLVDSQGPPPITLRFGAKSMNLEAFSFCWSEPINPGGLRQARCAADRARPTPPPDVGSPSEVRIEFPVGGFSFTASFQPVGKACGRVQTVPVEPRSDGSFLLRPAGYPDTYDVTLSGHGDGSMTTIFRWSTPSAGPLAVPDARLAVITNQGARVGSYGIKMTVDNLARTPGKATATVSVTAANGKLLSFEPTPAAGTCRPEGSLYWAGPDERGAAAAALGPAPFTYQVALVLDGKRHVATAKWPNDQIAGSEPFVALNFDPPLPSLR